MCHIDIKSENFTANPLSRMGLPLIESRVVVGHATPCTLLANQVPTENKVKTLLRQNLIFAPASEQTLASQVNRQNFYVAANLLAVPL